MSLYHELKRRNVIRVGIAYLAGAWLLIQVVETLFPVYGLPSDSVRLVVTLLGIGFPLALFFSWAFEITPEGLKRDRDVDPAQSISSVTGKKLDRITIAILTLALGYFAFDKFILDPARDVEIATTAEQAGVEKGLKEAQKPEFAANSIAVLPFADMSPNKDQEYFSDGLSDTLIHVLAQVSGLNVIAKTSSFYFKGKNINVGEIARELNVGTILEGSVQKDGNRVRVIAQLINAADGTHYWSKNFDRDLADIFAVQDEITREVVSALKVTLLDAEEARLAQRYQPNLEAYEQLILGRREMDKLTAKSLDHAERHFKRSIELDPDYALPYVDLANTYILQVTDSSILFEDALRLHKSLVDRAMELDPLSGEVFAARAQYHWAWRIKAGVDNYAAEERDILRALELNPNLAQAHSRYSAILSRQNKLEEALVQIRLAAELDPMSQTIQLGVTNAIWTAGRVEEALAQIRLNIERNPEFPENYARMASFQIWLGHLGVAQRWLQEARRLDQDDPYIWFWFCFGFLHLGDIATAESCNHELRDTYPDKTIGSSGWPVLHAYQGDWDKALDTLKSARERIGGFGPWNRWLPDWLAGQGEIETARDVILELHPFLLADELELEGGKLNTAISFAAILDANGEIERKEAVLNAIEKRISTMHRIRGKGYGVLDVYIHSLRNDREQAIAALREAIDMGWRIAQISDSMYGSWWSLKNDWKLANLHDDPGFISMVNELEADIAAQRQWYEENKDKPLF